MTVPKIAEGNTTRFFCMLFWPRELSRPYCTSWLATSLWQLTAPSLVYRVGATCYGSSQLHNYRSSTGCESVGPCSASIHLKNLELNCDKRSETIKQLGPSLHAAVQVFASSAGILPAATSYPSNTLRVVTVSKTSCDCDVQCHP